MHWEKRDSTGEVKKIGSTMGETSVLFPVASVSSLEVNGTSVALSCSGEYYLIRLPITPPSPSSGVSHLKLQKGNGTYCLQADRRVTVDDKSSTNMLTGFSPVQMAPIQQVELRHRRTWQNNFRMLQRLAKHRKSVCPLNRTTASSSRARSVCIESESKADSGNAHTATERYP